MKKTYFTVVAAVSLVTTVCSVSGVAIGIHSVRDLVNMTPVVVKGQVMATSDPSADEMAFQIQPGFGQFGGTDKKARVHIQSSIKGKIRNGTTNAVIFYSANGLFTRLEAGCTYILFLKKAGEVWRLSDPFNGGIRARSGKRKDNDSTPEEKLMAELEFSLGSSNVAVLCTAILALSDFPDVDSRPKVRPFLKHKELAVRAAATATCLHLGDWRLLPNATDMYSADPTPERIALPVQGIASLAFFLHLRDALGSVTNRQAAPLLIELLDETEDKRARRILVNALTRTSHPHVPVALLKLMHDENDDIAFAAYRKLAIMRQRTYVPLSSFKGEKKRTAIEDMEKVWGMR